MSKVAAAILPFYDAAAAAAPLFHLGSLAPANEEEPTAARDYVHRIAVMLSEIDDPILTAQTAFEIAPIAAALEVSWMTEKSDALIAPEIAACFAVSSAKKGGDDDPSY